MLARLTYLFYAVAAGWAARVTPITVPPLVPTAYETYTDDLDNETDHPTDELLNTSHRDHAPSAAPLRPWVEPDTTYLTQHLSQFGTALSVYFHNLATGFSFEYNADRRYMSASMPKAFFALYLYQQADAGLLDTQGLVTFLEQDHRLGSGVIRHRYPLGTRFSQRRLLQLMLEPSDNIATKMLVRAHGLAGFRQFAYETAGLAGNHVGSRIMNSHVTARETGAFARAIYDFIATDTSYAQMFHNNLYNDLFPFIVSDYPLISKGGDFPPHAWHSMAIVYAESPYLLVILSAREGWRAQDFREFREISLMFQAFNAQYFY